MYYMYSVPVNAFFGGFGTNKLSFFEKRPLFHFIGLDGALYARLRLIVVGGLGDRAGTET